MDDAADFNTWLRQLECPQSYTPDHVIKTLQKGVLGILWENLPKNVRPYSEVIETRKNILLYKLKNEPKDSLIQSVRDTSYLVDERKKLAAKIKIAEETWKQQEHLCRQKAHALEKKRSEKKKFSLKKEILKIKHEQMHIEIENCKKMKGVCQHFMPPTIEEIPQSVITDCLSLVSNYSGGPEKRKVWNKISEVLDPIKIPVIYNSLLSVRSYYTNYLISLDIEENQENMSEVGKNIDHGIAKLWSEHFVNKAQCVIYQNKKKNNEKRIISYVESIELIINELRPDLTDWLPLTLEVKKLELWQNELEKELAKLEGELPEEDVSIDDNLNQLILEIKIVDDQITDYVQKVKNTFGYLKSSRSLITKAKESLLSEIEKLKLLEQNKENPWHHIDLNTELIHFHNNIDIDALRKIVIKGKGGTYKHLYTCYNQAPLIVNSYTKSDKISNFPMLRVPIYYLLDLYKSVLTNVYLTKRINEEALCDFDEALDSVASPTIVEFPHEGILELLRQANLARNRTQQHSEEFERILKAWSEQNVREIVSKVFHDRTVHGATLEEWQKRFSMIVYVLQKSNMNT